MNIRWLILLYAVTLYEGSYASARIKIDGIKSTIYTSNSVHITTESDPRRPNLDGTPRTLSSIEFEILVFQDAQDKPGILLDDTETDKGLQKLLKDNNMTMKQLENIFRDAGYTYAEGREQFKTMSTVNQMLDYKIRSRLLVPEKEIMAYYHKHPIYEDARYLIQRAFVPFSSLISKQKLKKQITAHLRGNDDEDFNIEWSPEFWVQEDELAQEKQFITQLAVGQISDPVEVDNGFEVFKLVQAKERYLKPIEQRYTEIANILRKPRYDKLFDEYKQQLFDSASIVRFDD